jgi:hypothetical protein
MLCGSWPTYSLAAALPQLLPALRPGLSILLLQDTWLLLLLLLLHVKLRAWQRHSIRPAPWGFAC